MQYLSDTKKNSNLQTISNSECFGNNIATEWTKETITAAVDAQRMFFQSGKTLPVEWRVSQLRKLKEAVQANEQALIEALYEDLGRAPMEAYFCDIGSLILEINEYIKGTRKWAKPETHFSGLLCFPSVRTKVYKMPYGVTYIISPFNFPVLLSLGVLAAAISGGNTAVLRMSTKATACTALIERIIADTFLPEFVTCINGDYAVSDLTLEQRFDKVFYTGSPKIAKNIMHAAAEHLTPVALELGGETGNWCVVRADANICDAARKIAFFKILNSGQICININQVAVAEEIADEFIAELKAQFTAQIGNSPETNTEYPRLITRAAFDKCAREAAQYADRIVYGGRCDADSLKYAPTIIYPVAIDEPIVQHELFNPLLPVVTFKDSQVDELLETIAAREHGLALYLFTRDIAWANQVMQTQQYGGGCVNEVCVHLMVKGVPFGGTGHSGMGAYHGKYGFREFTHESSVLYGKPHGNLSLRMHPYNGPRTKLREKLIRLFER